jgi:hypothetical protein
LVNQSTPGVSPLFDFFETDASGSIIDWAVNVYLDDGVNPILAMHSSITLDYAFAFHPVSPIGVKIRIVVFEGSGYA